MNRFSIIIPTYNKAQFLRRSIESVITQRVNDWELIIVDDGSTDGTKQIVDNYIKQENVKYFYQNHSGVSAARNKGMELAQADYIIFLDSDDEFYPDLIEALLKIGYENYDLICWQACKIKKGKRDIWKPVKLEKIYNYLKATFLAGTACYHKELLIEAGGFDTKLQFGENYELGLRIAQNSNLTTRVLSKVYLNYYVNADFRPHSEPVLKLKALKYHLNKHFNLYKEDSYSYSRLIYQIGYLNEKLGREAEALTNFKKAAAIGNFYIKARLKQFYYQIRHIKFL